MSAEKTEDSGQFVYNKSQQDLNNAYAQDLEDAQRYRDEMRADADDRMALLERSVFAAERTAAAMEKIAREFEFFMARTGR